MAQRIPKKRWIRRLLLLVVVVVGLLCVAALVVQTPAGKRGLAGLASKLASGFIGVDITVAGISGSVPYDMRIETITIADDSGALVSLTGVDLYVSVSALLERRIHFSRLTVKELTLWRRPEPSERWRLPRLPSLPVVPTFDLLRIERLVLDEAVLGARAVLSVEGHVRPSEGWVLPEVAIEIVGLEATTAAISLSYSFADGAPRLRLTAEDEDILPAFLDLPAPVTLEVDGQGERADWRASLLMAADGDSVVDGTLHFIETEDSAFDVELRIESAHAPVLREYGALVGETVDLQAHLVLDRWGILGIQRIRAASAVFEIEMDGEVLLEQGDVALTVEGRYDDIGRFPGVSLRDAAIPLRATLIAGGALTNMSISAKAFLDDAPVLDGAIRLGTEDRLSALGAFTLDPPPFLFETMSYLPPDGIVVSFELNYDEDTGEAHLISFDLAGVDMLLEAHGRLMPELPTLELTATLDAADLATLGSLLSKPLSGAARVALDAKGDPDVLKVSMKTEFTDLAAAPARIGGGHVTLEGQCADWLSPSPTAIQARITAQATEVAISGMDPLDLQATLDLDAPTYEHVRISSFEISDGNAQVTGSGYVEPLALTGRVTLDATVNDIGELPVTSDAAPTGAATLHLEAQGGAKPPSFTASLRGNLTDIGNVPDAAAALAGDTLSVAVELGLADNSLEVSALSVEGAAFQASGTARYHLGTGDMGALLEADVPDLQPIGVAIDQAMSGVLRMTLALRGPSSDPTAEATLTARDVLFGDLPVLRADAELTGGNFFERPEITVDGRIYGGEQLLDLTGVAALEPGRVAISPVRITAGANQISGTAAYSFETGRPEAQFDLALPDLAAFAALTGLDMTGKADGEMTLSEDGATAAVRVHGLRYGAVHLEGATLDARLEALYDLPAADISLGLQRLSAGPAEVEGFLLAIQGDLNAARISVRTNGVVNTGLPEAQAFQMDLLGDLSAAERRFALNRFDGDLGDVEYALETPLPFAFSEGRATVGASSLRLGDGRLFLEGALGPESVQGRIRIEDIPLSLSRLVAGPDFIGQLAGDLQLAGTPDDPEITLALTVAQARIDLDTAEGFAPLEARMDAALARGRLVVSLNAEVEDTLELDVALDAPVLFRLMPFTAEPLRDGPLSGKSEFSIYFAPLVQAMGLIEHHVDARMTGLFELRGAMNAPEIVGDAHIRDGRYENAVTGTLLRNINVHARADGTVVRLNECRADTGRRGSISAEGVLRAVPAEQFPFEATLTLADAQLAQLDYLTGQVGGNIKVEGSLGGALVTGDLEIGPVQVSMPDELPAREPLVLEISEIRDGKTITPPESATAGFASTIDLDIRCNVPGRVYVRAPILDSEWGGNLHLTGTAADPKIEGRISVLRGHLDFLSRRFMLRDSAIMFLGGSPTDPYLDMRATTTTPALSAQLNVMGELDTITLELSSEPSLPQDEILAQILFGRDLSHISPVQAIQLARIATMFNRNIRGLQLFSGNVGLPGIGRLDIRTGERADDTVVGMGRYFTDSVYVEVEQGTTTDSGKISVEVEISPQISVKGDVDAHERSGIGLFWRRDY